MSADLEEGSVETFPVKKVASSAGFCASNEAVQLLQKVIAETIGTYMVIFCGCGAVVVNKMYGEVSFPGICVVWGLIVMVMVYSVGHISGAHFNPAVTLTFAVFKKFPYKQVPLYIVAQVIGSLLASGTLSLLYGVPDEAFYGTIPVGSELRSFYLEILITFLLMFVISGVATDNRAMFDFFMIIATSAPRRQGKMKIDSVLEVQGIGELAGIAVGMTIMLNVFIAGPISGASMNPARSLGPAIVMHKYKGIWVYIVGPLIGAILGAFAYNLIRFTDKPLREITKSSSFIRSFRGT